MHDDRRLRDADRARGRAARPASSRGSASSTATCRRPPSCVRLVQAGTVGRPRMVAMREHRFPFLTKVGNWNRFTRHHRRHARREDVPLLRPHEPASSASARSGSWRRAPRTSTTSTRCYDGRPADMLDNAFVIVDYPGGARALLDLCMFAEATHHQEEMSVVGAARQGRGAHPRRHDPRRPPRRALDRWRRVVPRRRPADRPRGPAPRLELPRARPLPRRRPHRHARRGDAGGRPVVRRHGRRRPPQHRARPPRRDVRVAPRPRPVPPLPRMETVS